MNEGTRNIAEIARQKAVEKIPEALNAANDFQKLIGEKRQIEILQNSLFPNRGIDSGIKQEAQGEVRGARDVVYSEVDKVAADLRAGGVKPEDFKRDIETAVGQDTESFSASEFGGDEAAQQLHEKVRKLKTIESANQDSEPFLRVRLEAFGVSGEALDAKVQHVYAMSMRPDEITPEAAFRTAVREVLQEKRQGVVEQMNAAIATRPELKKLAEDAETAPAVVELSQQIQGLDEREKPLNEEDSKLSSERWVLNAETRNLDDAEKVFAAAEKYGDYLLDAPIKFYANGKDSSFYIETKVPFEILARKEQQRATKLARLKGERAEFAAKKAGGWFGMKEEDKVAGLKKLDDEIELLSSYKKQLETRTTLPDKESLKKYCDHVGQMFKSELGNEQLAKVVKASGLQSGVTLRAFIEGMRTTISTQEAVRGPERAAALDENNRKNEEVGGQARAIRDERAPLAKAKEALEDLKRQ